MINNVSIRPAFYDDESAIVEIMNHGIEEETNAYVKPFDWVQGSNWFSSLRENATALVVAEINNQIVGWGGLSNYRGGREALSSTKEITFYVHHDFRRMGAASKLILNLEETAMDLNAKHLVAILLDDNEGSRALLEKHQYFVWGLFEAIAEFESGPKGHLYMGKHL
ncbi:GNAT family N-acetyltransferase [Salibacteraceae bacterium]|nr:GNAT family N-acetyltransferase [Flavobacteriales bacterium]MDC1202515.1 GNAT family N-acetyltransferase [Salibacteraceae bacterium]